MENELPRDILESLQQYQKVHDKAIELFNLFEDSEPDELLRHKDRLSDELDKLINISELEWSECGSIGRHLHFLSYYLSRDNKRSCFDDINLWC
jgi:hypothetical protein